MYFVEELVAAALAIGLGLALLAAPTTVYRLQFFVYGADTGRGGRYGEAPAPTDRVRVAIRALGLVLLAFAAVLLASPLWR